MWTFHAPVADAHKPLWDDNVAVGLRSHFLRTETLPALARCPLSIRGLLKFATAATGRDVPIPDTHALRQKQGRAGSRQNLPLASAGP
jgi:hypothetical protein